MSPRANPRPEAGIPDVKILAGKRIVITRAPGQSPELTRLLQEMGAEVILFPVLVFAEPVDTLELDAALRSLENFDWLLFTSANAVRFFAARARELALRQPLQPLGLKIASIGPATAQAAAQQGLRVDFVASRHSGTAIAAELASLIRGKKILLPRSDIAAPELPAALRAFGAQVLEVVAYRTESTGPGEHSDSTASQASSVQPGNLGSQSAPSSGVSPRSLASGAAAADGPSSDSVSADSSASAIEASENSSAGRSPQYELDQLRKAQVDVVTFASPSAFRNFSSLLGRESLHRLAQRALFAALGPATAAAIRQAGLCVLIEARESTVAGLAVALADYYRAVPSSQQAPSSHGAPS